MYKRFIHRRKRALNTILYTSIPGSFWSGIIVDFLFN